MIEGWTKAFFIRGMGSARLINSCRVKRFQFHLPSVTALSAARTAATAIGRGMGVGQIELSVKR
jgi:hypothetical protein